MWDSFPTQITNFRAYLNYNDDNNAIENTTLQICKVINETFEKRPLGTTQNATNFLNALNYMDMKTLGIKYMTINI